jgi:hypothetical protein
MARYALNLRPNDPQRAFLQDDLTFYLAYVGGMGSGKSHGLCAKMLDLSRKNFPFPGGLMCPSYTDLKRDILPLMDALLEENRIPVRYHKSANYYRFPWTPGRLYMFTGEKQLRGPNLAYGGINEFTLIQKVRFQEMAARIRLKGAHRPQLALVGTPEGIANWAYESLVEKPLPNSKIIHATTDDNRANLSDQYFQILESSFDKRQLAAYRQGLWINMTGDRFYYSYEPTKNDDRRIAKVSGETILCSLDFNVDPMRATLWHRFGDQIFAFDEISLEDGEGYETKHMVDALKSRGYTPMNTVIYPDPAGQSRSTKGQPDVKVLRNAGYTVRVKPSAPGMRERQLNVNNLLDKRQIMLNPDACPNLRKDLLGVEVDKVRLEKKKNNPKVDSLLRWDGLSL